MTDTKGKLLDAAATTLRQSGITGLSARSIAAAAGVNQALIFYHFAGVSDLVVAASNQAVDRSIGHYREEFARIGSLVELLEAGRRLHQREREIGNVELMAQLMAGAQHDASLAGAARYALRTWSVEIEAVLRRVLAGSPLELVSDPGGLARAISASFIGLQLYEGVDPDAAGSALDALERLGVLVDVMEDLGPVGRRALQRQLKRHELSREN